MSGPSGGRREVGRGSQVTEKQGNFAGYFTKSPGLLGNQECQRKRVQNRLHNYSIMFYLSVMNIAYLRESGCTCCDHMALPTIIIVYGHYIIVKFELMLML